MKTLLKIIVLMTACFFDTTGIAYAGVYDKVIFPVSIDKIKNDTIRREFAAIQNKPIDPEIRVYRTKYLSGATITMNYKGQNRVNDISISSDNGRINNKGKRAVNIICKRPTISDIRFFHVKYMLTLDSASLSCINENYLSPYNEQESTIEAKSFLSYDYLREYLMLTITSKELVTRLVFIRNNAVFHCVATTEKYKIVGQ